MKEKVKKITLLSVMDSWAYICCDFGLWNY